MLLNDSFKVAKVGAVAKNTANLAGFLIEWQLYLTKIWHLAL